MQLMSIGAEHHRSLATYLFRTRRLWSTTRKMIPRQLKNTLPEIASNWEKCFSALYETGNTEHLIAMIEELLEPEGGLIFDGYSQIAPKNWRYENDEKL